MREIFGGVEAGGSKFVCGVGDAAGQLIHRQRITTTTPAETIANVGAFFRGCARDAPLSGLGIGAFGPVDLKRHSPTYGYITTTPKPAWQQFDLAGMLVEATGILNVSIDTDVNCAALAESLWGAGRNCDPLVYMTFGTGIGGGVIVHGKALHGLVHPEMGHLRVPRDARDPFPGCCPSHGDCLEGLASGTAMAQRWGMPAHQLPPNHPAWRLETHYVALGLANIILTLSPQKIVLGGGLRAGLLWRELFGELQQLLNGYVRAPELGSLIASYIVEPGLGDDAGVLGAIALAASQSPATISNSLVRSVRL
jgi:fructokinase